MPTMGDFASLATKNIKKIDRRAKETIAKETARGQKRRSIRRNMRTQWRSARNQEYIQAAESVHNLIQKGNVVEHKEGGKVRLANGFGATACVFVLLQLIHALEIAS